MATDGFSGIVVGATMILLSRIVNAKELHQIQQKLHLKQVQAVTHLLQQIQDDLKVIKKNCHRMDSHVSFVEMFIKPFSFSRLR